jgi:hypothetical protein
MNAQLRGAEASALKIGVEVRIDYEGGVGAAGFEVGVIDAGHAVLMPA